MGTHLPPVVSAEEAVARGWYDAGTAERSGWTGAAVAGELSAPEMAVLAATAALERSGHPPDDVAVLLHASTMAQGPEAWPPQSYVQRRTVGGDAPALEVRQACNGMLAGMELAARWLTADARPAALVTGADNFGLPLIDRWRYAEGAGTDRLSVLGDAGAAVVLSRRGGFARLLAVGTLSVPALEEMYRGGLPLFPPEQSLGRPVRIGERLRRYRETDPASSAAARRSLDAARLALGTRTLAEAGVTADRVTRATHVFSGGAAYLESVLGPLGIDASRGLLEFGRTVGHLATCDHVVGLEHLVLTGAVGPGDHVLMMSNGGASLACAVVELVARPTWAGP
ncbi:ketoacyl-ACP synthase III family protein [Kitasatospora phosalacinea]|uniref:ketoacyl-ACP synthase III family protein n=1 Tax=Kitasatospora phosalacinea TaxID=2065 RepID=UPI002555FD60|nr:ketoacyl-ACP synthase III family protein [Kitasatospora phosalacinea]